MNRQLMLIDDVVHQF